MEQDYELDVTQLMLWDGDRIAVDCRWTDTVGWEWTMRHLDGRRGWALLDSGTAKTPQSAMAQAAEALLELAHGWEF